MPIEETENEIRARVRSPGDFQPDSFRRKALGGGVSIVIGKLKTGDSMVTQAYRFDRGAGWTIEKARNWLSGHKIALLGEQEYPDGTDLIPLPTYLILDGSAPIEILANNAEPYNGGNKFYVEGEAIRPGTYHACNMDHPVNYPPDIMNAIAEQLEGQPIRYWHAEMDKLQNLELNKIGVVTDTKVSPDGRVLYHGFINKHKYQAFMAALVDERHVDPKEIPTFEEFTKLIKNKTLGGSSVGLRVDGKWDNGAYLASNPNVQELSIVPQGAAPNSTTKPSNRWGILALNSAKTPDGGEYLTGEIVIYNEAAITDTTPKPSETTSIDIVGELAGLARLGADAVDVSKATEEVLMAIVQFVDGFKAKAFARLHGTKADNSQSDNDGEAKNDGGDVKLCLTTKNQTLKRVTIT